MEEGCTIDGKFHNLEVENLLTTGEFKISDSIALTDITLQESIDIGTSATIGTDLTVDTNTLVVNSTNNNVGIGVDQPISTLKLDVSGNVRINGNLEVIGTTTSTTEEATSISAPLQQLGTGTTGQPSNDSGIVIERGDEPNVFMGWDESENKFIMGIAPNASNENITADSSGDLTLIKQDLQVSGIIAENLTGTITPVSASQPNITGVGTITSGTWQGTSIDDNYISSSATWNSKQDALTFGISNDNVIKCGTGIADDDFLRVNGTTLEGISSSELKTDIGLDNVENTALSTWSGSTSITTLGTITTGTWNGTAIPIAHGGTGATTASGAATALGLGTGDSPQFTSINLGHASDTVITRDSAGVVSIAGNEVRTGTVPANKGGTGETSYTSGKLLIGNSSGGLTSSTLTPGSGISIVNGDLGSITISADASEFIGLTDTPDSYTSYAKHIIQVKSAADGLEFTKSPELSTIGLRVSGTDNQFTVGIDNNDNNKFKIGTTAIDTNPRLTIDSAGNVGIGNSSPGHLLDVDGDINLTTTNDYKINDTSVLNETTLGSNIVNSSLTSVGALDGGSITSGFGNIDIGDSTITTTGSISGGTITGELTTASQPNITSVGALNGGSITSGFGDINIGTSTITCNSISGTVTTASQPNITSVGTLNTLNVTDDITISGTSSNDSTITLQTNSSTKYVMGIDVSDNDKFKIGTTSINTDTRFSIDTSGNVGIGTNNPVSTLQLKVPSSKDATDASNFDHYGIIISKVGTPSDGTETGICFDIQDGADPVDTRGPGAAITHERTGNWSQGKLHFKTKQLTQNDADCVTAMTIAQTGNVGIGTTSPSTLLELSSNEPYLTLTNTTEENTDGGAESKIIFNDHSDTSLAQIQASHDGTSDDTKGDLIFSTNDGTSVNEALRIDYQGNVGIGTTVPQAALHVNGNSRFDGSISYGGTNKTASLYIKGTGTNNPANRLVILSGQTIVNTKNRGLTLTIINGQTLEHVSSTNYDTYHSATNADNLATEINNMTHTQIGILTSEDSFTRYVSSNLRTAAMRVGLTKLASVAISGQTNYDSREPYAAIFYGTSSDSASTPQYIRDVIEIYRNNEEDGGSSNEAPPAIISTTLSSDGNYAGIAGASSVNALWAASPIIENPALICDKEGNVGIGTITPTEKLEVNGNIKGTNFIGTLNNYDSSRFFRREGRTNTSTDIGPGWISVATCGGGRYAGEILVTDSRSVSHSYIRIHWMVSFSQTNFTVINSGGWITNITGVRVLYEPASYSTQTYGDKILQVYVEKTANYSVSIFRMGDDPYFGTFTAVTPVVENTKTNFGVRTELTDIHVYGFAHQKGILAGGDLKVNGLIHSRNNDATYNSNINDTTSYPECGILFSSSNNKQWVINPNDNDDLSMDFYSRDSLTDRWDRAAYLHDSTANRQLNFTGQHRNILNKNIDETYIGLIVSSTGKYVNINNSLNTNINESLPICSITNIDNDIKVFGVISDKEDTNNNREYSSGNFVSSYKKTNNNEQRMFINSLGEGAIWVCNKNGNLVNGDYISSSSVPGYGMKQITNKLLNSTVAKITCNCDFSLTKIVKQKLKVITTTETYEVNVFEEIQKTQTKNIIEYDEELSRYVQKEITKTITETKQLYDTVDLYNEDGEVIGTHQIERKETKTRTVTEIDYDENGDVQYEDDLDADGNQQMIYPYNTRFLLPDATQITEEEYSTKLSAGEQVYIACFVGCTYHCG